MLTKLQSWPELARKTLRKHCYETGESVFRAKNLNSILLQYSGRVPKGEGNSTLIAELIRNKTIRRTDLKGHYEIIWFSKTKEI